MNFIDEISKILLSIPPKEMYNIDILKSNYKTFNKISLEAQKHEQYHLNLETVEKLYNDFTKKDNDLHGRVLYCWRHLLDKGANSNNKLQMEFAVILIVPVLDRLLQDCIN